MDFGCVFPNRGPLATPANLLRVAEKAEALGYDTVWFSDHIIIPTEVKSFYPYHPSGQMQFNPSEPYWEPLTAMSYVAGRTSRLRLGTSVLVLPYRNPVVTAKMLATLDVLSNGRVTLGAGVGWMEEEFNAIGLDTYSRRGTYSDECIRIFRELWTRDNPSFQGEFHQFSNVRCEPRPVQPGGIPIWVGGHTPQAIRRAARLADGWQPLVQRPPADLPPAEMKEKIGPLSTNGVHDRERHIAFARIAAKAETHLRGIVRQRRGNEASDGSGFFSSDHRAIVIDRTGVEILQRNLESKIRIATCPDSARNRVRI